MATPAGKVPTLECKRFDHRDCEEETPDLSPELWQGLPEHLVEVILGKLPLSSLLRCCSISKRWSELILSSELSPRSSSSLARLLYFYEGKLSVFNSNIGAWEAVSLEFLEKKFKLLDLVASDGGLLCFLTKVDGEFIVCNPLTKCYTRLLMPYGKTTVARPTRMAVHLVGMVVDSHSGHFKLVVVGVALRSRRTSLVYDSGTNSWQKGPEIPQGIFYNKLRPIVCGGNLYFSFIGGAIGDRMLKYDVKKDDWSWILMRCDLSYPRKLIEHNGEILLMVARDDRSAFEFYELIERKPTLDTPETPLSVTTLPPMNKVHEDMVDMSGSGIECLGQGDVIFFIQKNLRPGSPVTSSKINLKVWSHNFSTKANAHSKWEVWGHGTFPLGLCCQVFKPSLLRVN